MVISLDKTVVSRFKTNRLAYVRRYTQDLKSGVTSRTRLQQIMAQIAARILLADELSQLHSSGEQRGSDEHSA